MKTLGLVGGTGWISSLEYYRIINEETNRVLGELNAARCVLYSLNFQDIEECNRRNDSEGIYSLLLEAARKVEQIGAEGLVLCANTMHKYADRLAGEIRIPIIHIARATADHILRQGLSTVGLLGTRYTMEEGFYTDKLHENGVKAIVPGPVDREFIHNSIYNELLKENFRDDTRARFIAIMEKLREQGAEGIVLGCTEIPLLIHDGDYDRPLFNTLVIHSKAAVAFALEKE
jgi:aspartate racemase